MNKQLLDQVQQALQVNRDTIARQKQIIQWREQEIKTKESHIAQLTESLNQLAASQAQELKALPSLFADLKISMKGTTTAYQNWMEAQKLRQDSQKRLTDELIKVANRQLELTKVLTSYQQDIPSLENFKADTIKIESELSTLETSQAQINSSKSLTMTMQSAIEKQVINLSQLLQQLES